MIPFSLKIHCLDSEFGQTLSRFESSSRMAAKKPDSAPLCTLSSCRHAALICLQCVVSLTALLPLPPSSTLAMTTTTNKVDMIQEVSAISPSYVLTPSYRGTVHPAEGDGAKRLRHGRRFAIQLCSDNVWIKTCPSPSIRAYPRLLLEMWTARLL